MRRTFSLTEPHRTLFGAGALTKLRIVAAQAEDDTVLGLFVATAKALESHNPITEAEHRPRIAAAAILAGALWHTKAVIHLGNVLDARQDQDSIEWLDNAASHMSLSNGYCFVAGKSLLGKLNAERLSASDIRTAEVMFLYLLSDIDATRIDWRKVGPLVSQSAESLDVAALVKEYLADTAPEPDGPVEEPVNTELPEDYQKALTDAQTSAPEGEAPSETAKPKRGKKAE